MFIVNIWLPKAQAIITNIITITSIIIIIIIIIKSVHINNTRAFEILPLLLSLEPSIP